MAEEASEMLTRKSYSYYIELRTAHGNVTRYTASVNATSEEAVEAIVTRMVGRNGGTVLHLTVWEEDGSSETVALLNSYYKEITDKAEKGATSAPVRKYPKPVELVPPPEEGFGSLSCFERMQRAAARGKATDRRENYDLMFEELLLAKKKK